MRRRSGACKFFFSILIFSLFPHSLTARPFVLVLSQDYINEGPTSTDNPSDADSDADWDNLSDSDTHKSEEELDPGSWRPIFELDSDATTTEPVTELEALYYSGVGKMMLAVSSGDVTIMEDATGEIEAAAESGYPAAQSVLGFLHGMGLLRGRSKAKAFLHHYFAAEGGNMQSKMALAYAYTCQDVSNLTPLASCTVFVMVFPLPR